MPNDVDILVRKLKSITDLSDDDVDALTSLPFRIAELEPDQDFLRDGEIPDECCLLIDGFMYRYKLLANGKRQIFAFHTPGDVPDLQSLYLDLMDHSVGALVRSKVGFISHESLRAVMRRSPSIAAAFWRDLLVDAAIFRAWMVGMGQRSAHGHLSHLLLELFTRLRAVGLVVNDTCPIPITQAELGDALGLSTVHVNRTLQELRGEGLIELHGSRLTILDWEKMVQAAQFDPAYLHLRKPEPSRVTRG